LSSLINRIETNFTQVSNNIVSNSEISFKAKGIYLHLMSKPDGWKFFSSEIVKSAKDGKEAVKSGLKELEEKGYLERTKVHGEHGQFTYNYEIFSEPQLCEPAMGFTTTVEPASSNTLPLSNTNLSKRKYTKKVFQKPTVEEVRVYCKERNNSIDAEKFVAHYEASNWYRGKTKITNWKQCVITWEGNDFNSNGNNNESSQYNKAGSIEDYS